MKELDLITRNSKYDGIWIT